MTQALVLNELSYDGWNPSEHEAGGAIRSLAESLREIASHNPQLYLLSRERLSDITFAEGMSLRRFVGVRDAKEATLAIFAFANRSPFSVDEAEVDGYECIYRGRQAIGLLYCCVNGGVAISFPSSEEWRKSVVEVQLVRLAEGDGGTILEESDQRVPNVGCVENVDWHKEILAASARSWATGRELWDDRAQFSKLILLSRVEAQLQGLSDCSEELRQISDRLQELQRSVEEWVPAREPFPVWRSHVTGEGEQRKRLAMFTDDAGIEHCYDLHARYTPGVGRIHFRLLRETGMIEIAHIGLKL